MPSSNRRPIRRQRQAGFGLIDALVANALLAVALVVVLGSFSSLLVGSRVAERRTVEGRLARNALESLMAQPFGAGCGSSTRQFVDGVGYVIGSRCVAESPGLVTYTVSVADSTGVTSSLSSDRAALEPAEGD